MKLELDLEVDKGTYSDILKFIITNPEWAIYGRENYKNRLERHNWRIPPCTSGQNFTVKEFAYLLKELEGINLEARLLLLEKGEDNDSIHI